MKMHKAILFDLDGTLLDTSEGIKRSLLYVIKEMNLPALSENEINVFIGPPIYRSLIEKYKLSELDAKRGTEIFRDIYSTKYLCYAEVYDGVIETLQYLRDKGYKIGVATYKRYDYANKILDAFELSKYCDKISGSDFDNKMSKTDIIVKCYEDLGVKRENVLMIGDTMHDWKGAVEAGVDFVGVEYGFGEFKKAEIMTIQSLKDIKQFI